MDVIDNICSKVHKLIALKKFDEAIDTLRTDESNEDLKLISLLSKVYYLRNHKGDHFAALYFAERAISLASNDKQLKAIAAVIHFKRMDYNKAIIFLKDIYCSNTAAKELLNMVTEKLMPQISSDFINSLVNVKSNLGGRFDHRNNGEPTPYKESSLSIKSGISSDDKDIYWAKKNIPCQEECPAHTDIPGYLAAIYTGDFGKAYRINLRDNVFPGVLGRVCARPCESKCRHSWEGLGDSVAICFSKRSSSDLNNNTKLIAISKSRNETGKKVSIIGAGPAGLTAARNLSLLGHTVTVYEQHSKPGGMMIQGIPEFRLPRNVIENEIKQIQLCDVKIISNCKIGKDIHFEALYSNSDAVIIAAGTLTPNIPSTPGADKKGIIHGLEFLLNFNTEKNLEIGKKIVVIGGGFTAMDCARSAKRTGCTSQNSEKNCSVLSSNVDVKVFYRRSENEMQITPGELEELYSEGISMEFLVEPVEYLVEDGRLKSVKLIKNKLGEPDSSGRRKPVQIPGSEFVIEADTVLLATGQSQDYSWINRDFISNVDSSSKTAHQKLFFAGDFATGAKSLINAIGHAKKCVEDVDNFLTGSRNKSEYVTIEDAPLSSERITEMNKVPVNLMPTLDVNKRFSTTEVEQGYSMETAVDETQRCYQCNIKYEIDPQKCIYCDWCIKAKPRPNCILRVSGLKFGNNGEIIGYETAKTIEETKLIYINQEDCIRCNACVDACPVDAISIQRVSRCSFQTSKQF